MATYQEIVDRNNEKRKKDWEEFQKLSPKQKMIQKILAPLGVLAVLLLVAGVLGKGAHTLVFIVLFFIGLGTLRGAFKNETGFIRIYYIIWGVLFSTPATLGVLAYFGF